MYHEAIEILNILESNGYKAYIVGGYVRDKLLKIDNSDIDIITSAKPYEICRLFKLDNNYKYGSVKLNYKKHEFDVTTFRKEEDYIDNRWPSNITYIDDVKDDLKRRDFTINAILIDKNGKYIDLYNGINDLNNKVLKVIGDSNKKMEEDSLRIIRALRFSSVYNLKMDDELKSAIIRNKKLINNLSFDRIKNELNIIFSSSNVSLFFDTINNLDLYETLKIRPINGIKTTNNYLSIWSQLEYSNEYNFSRNEKKTINDIRFIIDNGIDNYTIYKYGKDLNKESNKILEIEIDIDDIYNSLPIKSRNDIKIKYDEILNIVKDASSINEIYMDLEKKILYNKLKNERKSIISYLEGGKYE